MTASDDVQAAIPGLIVRSVPAQETGSALGVNQVLRQIGFSIGSALGATILTAHTVAPDTLPTSAGYTVSALVGVVLCLFAAVASFVLPSRQSSPLSAPTMDRARMQRAPARLAVGAAEADEFAGDGEVVPQRGLVEELDPAERDRGGGRESARQRRGGRPV